MVWELCSGSGSRTLWKEMPDNRGLGFISSQIAGALPPLLLIVEWLVDRLPFISAPAACRPQERMERGPEESREGGRQCQKVGSRATGHPTPQLCALIFLSFLEGSTLTPPLPSAITWRRATQNSPEGNRVLDLGRFKNEQSGWRWVPVWLPFPNGEGARGPVTLKLSFWRKE